MTNWKGLKTLARKVFRLTCDAGLASIGPEGGAWSGLRPLEEQLLEVVGLVAKVCGIAAGVEAAVAEAE